jgi:UDP-N-acetylglucosamine--N-acetylmuramyl-(pentapeptide) pyrophosphoryl-undecaprenol N-acetylglucosamine transferase
MNNTINSHVLIVAGGTGGHIFPGLAVADELKKHGVKLSWVGTSRGLESKVVTAANITLFTSSFKGVRGKGCLSLLLLPWRLLLAVFEMARLIKKIKPDYIACFGGYITVPVGLSSIILQTPFLVHEQNAIMGSANRFLSKIARKVFVSFETTRHSPTYAKFVGNPLRNSFNLQKIPEKRWQERIGPLRILVLGGSLGASVLNHQVPIILAKVTEVHKLNFLILHQSGENDQREVDTNYKNLGLQAEVKSFIDEVAHSYAWADLVICRSGAGTVSELATVGVGSILIPLPNAIDNHQMLNAQLLLKSGAAIVVEEKNISGKEILSFFHGSSRASLLPYAIRARKCSSTKSALKISNEILKSMVKN